MSGWVSRQTAERQVEASLESLLLATQNRVDRIGRDELNATRSAGWPLGSNEALPR